MLPTDRNRVALNAKAHPFKLGVTSVPGTILQTDAAYAAALVKATLTIVATALSCPLGTWFSTRSQCQWSPAADATEHDACSDMKVKN